MKTLPAAGLLCWLLLLCSHAGAEDNKTPLKVYVLVGQSNMEGHAHVRVLDYLGEDPKTAPLLEAMKNKDGSFRQVDQTWISYLTGGRDGNGEVHGLLQAGYGSLGGRLDQPGEKIGPELAFGITMQQQLKQPILIIKAAWGGKSLNLDFRSPSSGPFEKTEANAKRFETEEQRSKLKAATGARYRQMIGHVRHVLGDIKRVCPAYDEKQGYELAGFVWFQGWNDMVDRSTYPKRDQPGGYDKYSEWMANFIRDVRKDLKAPEMPFVIGVMGVGGPLKKESRYYNVHSNFRKAMAAPAGLDEFKGNVVAVETGKYWDMKLQAIDDKRQQIRAKAGAIRGKRKGHENEDGKMSPDEIKKFMAEYEKKILSPEDLALEKRAKSNAAYHYLGSARTYSLIGEAFAQALLED